jgi:hypothetical protein
MQCRKDSIASNEGPAPKNSTITLTKTCLFSWTARQVFATNDKDRLTLTIKKKKIS